MSLIKSFAHHLGLRQEKEMGRSVILLIGGVRASKAQNIQSGMYCRSPDKGKKAEILLS